jgi:ribosome biogenesis protein ERB1
VGDEETEDAAVAALKLTAKSSSAGNDAVVQWRQREDGGLELQHRHSLRQLTWHSRGDYFATVAPTGNTQVLPCYGVV